MDIHNERGSGDSWAYGPRRRSVTRTKRLSVLAAVTAFFVIALSAVAVADVWTDKYDYAYGETVQIKGDGMEPGEAVAVDVHFPDGSLAQHHEVTADEFGNFSDSFYLADGMPVGVYTVVATGLISGNVFTTEFDPGNLDYSPGTYPAAVSPGGSTSFTQTVTAPKNNGTFSAVLKVTGLPSDWGVTTSKSSLSFTTTATSGASDSWVVTITVPSGTACATYTGNIKANPPPGGPGEGPGTAVTIDVTGCAPANPLPTALANGPYSGNEGAEIDLNGTVTGITDTGDTGSITWTLDDYNGNMDADGSCLFSNDGGTTWVATGTIEDPKVKCNDDSSGGTFTLRLVAADGVNPNATATAVLTVTNVLPTVAFDASSDGTNPISVSENATTEVTYGYTISDPGSNDTVDAVDTSCGSNGIKVSGSDWFNNSSGSFKCVFPDGAAAPAGTDTTLSAAASDDDDAGYGTADTLDVNIQNVAPTVTASITETVDCRANATLSFSFSDPGVNDGPWAVDVDWGDGSSTGFSVAFQGDQIPQTHAYVTPDTYTAVVTVTDKDGGTGSDDDNTVTVEQVYTVDFLPPFDDSSPSGLIVNKMKNGRVVPVKATIYDVCTQSYLTDPSASVTIKVSKTSGTGTGDPIEEYADAGSSNAGTNAFRWSDDSFWIYNLDSKALGLVVNNLYRVDIYVAGVKATKDVWAVLQPVK